MNDKAMNLAIEKALKTSKEGIGGPFGAAIVKNGEIIAVASNSVLKDKDPTAHAEVNAIRKACQILDTYDLSGCELFATSYPCPMCLSAIIWANIDKVYYGCTATDAKEIGFRDDFIYNFIKNGCINKDILSLKQMDRQACLQLFQEYKNNNKTIY